MHWVQWTWYVSKDNGIHQLNLMDTYMRFWFRDCSLYCFWCTGYTGVLNSPNINVLKIKQYIAATYVMKYYCCTRLAFCRFNIDHILFNIRVTFSEIRLRQLDYHPLKGYDMTDGLCVNSGYDIYFPLYGTQCPILEMIDSTTHILTTEVCNLSPFRGIWCQRETQIGVMMHITGNTSYHGASRMGLVPKYRWVIAR